MRSIAWWHFQWPWRTLTQFSRSRHFWSRISQKRRILYDGTTFNDLEWPLPRISRSRHFVKSNIRKTPRLKVKVTIAQDESIPNIWNGTMFADLDWPLNASRGFVGISWASCSFLSQAPLQNSKGNSFSGALNTRRWTNVANIAFYLGNGTR